MKNTYLISGLLLVVIIFSRCEEQVENQLTNEAAEQRVLDKIKRNQGISMGLFDILGDRIGADSLKRLVAGTPSDREFIDLIAEQTLAYFNDVVESNKTDFLIAAVPTPFNGEAEITLKGLMCPDAAAGAAPIDPVQAYSDLILKRINEQTASDDHKDWIIIESLHEAGSTPRHMPAEEFSLNFEEIKILTTIPHMVIQNTDLSDEEVLETLSDIMSTHDIPPVAIALLLPAVQKFQEFQESSTATEPFDTALLAWLDETVTPAINGGFNRDIIRRIQATAYLAGLHALILPEYQNKNQDLASLSILHARYRAAVIGTSRELWAK